MMGFMHMFTTPGKQPEISIPNRTLPAFFEAGSHLLPKGTNSDLIGLVILKGEREDEMMGWQKKIYIFFL